MFIASGAAIDRCYLDEKKVVSSRGNPWLIVSCYSNSGTTCRTEVSPSSHTSYLPSSHTSYLPSSHTSYLVPRTSYLPSSPATTSFPPPSFHKYHQSHAWGFLKGGHDFYLYFLKDGGRLWIEIYTYL